MKIIFECSHAGPLSDRSDAVDRLEISRRERGERGENNLELRKSETQRGREAETPRKWRPHRDPPGNL